MNKNFFLPDVNQFIIAKIGGTSVANFKSMNNSANIILTNKNIRLVVLSASAGITNLLIELSEGCKENKRCKLLQKIKKIQFSIINKLETTEFISKKINNILDKIIYLSKLAQVKKTKILTDEIVSYGELMSTLVFVEILRQRNINSKWFDIRNIMKTNENFGQAKPKIAELKKFAEQQLLPILIKSLVITQGFIGCDKNGHTTTIGRGGSDYTATLLAEALNLSHVEIWTDVPGIYTADPHIVPNAQRIDEITFNEATEMAIFGAKILHPATLLPAIRTKISVFIGSSQNPEAGGTVINHKTISTPYIKSLAIRRKQVLLILDNIKIFNIHIFLIKIFAILLQHNIPIELINITKSSVVLIINTTIYIRKNNDLLKNILISKLSYLCCVKIEENFALVTIIGNKLLQIHGLTKRIIDSLKSFDIRMINYGTSYNNICLLISDHNAKEFLQILHTNLFDKI
ncbi:Lysine-sensitive aspartokinase 3 [Candidatus Providencia siddallii]|uniref:Aspartokinase n=1 Tax=Candidatus Providencia siddallii TaxID=1715285 RepID=A0A0M6W8D8_9GAMM|nr:Lysine-sensitive aspartokinase 3 [Candidatus Providencia siddallii]